MTDEIKKLKLEKDDVLIITENNKLTQHEISKLNSQMKELSLDNLLIVLPVGMKVEALDSKRMNAKGWYKKEDV